MGCDAATAKEAITEAENVLSGTWNRVSVSATAQITAMASVAAQMELDYAAVPPLLTQDEYQCLKSAQKNALEGILSAYKAIGIVAAEQAADAAWAVIETALKASIAFI